MDIRYYLSSKHIVKSVEQSLINLNVDYLDSLLIHRPSPLMDPEQVADALTKLVKQGKLKSFGVSNFNHSQYQLLNQYIMKERLHISINQLELSPYHVDSLQDGTMDSCIKTMFKLWLGVLLQAVKFSTRKILKRNVL